MNRILNLPSINDALIKAGLNQSALAERLDVSREAVSKWMRQETFPTPDKLLRIGMLLGLAFEKLVIVPAPTAVPVVSFRKKSHRKTTDVHLDKAREIGELLKRLVKYLPPRALIHPPTLQDPRPDYTYVQQVASVLRKEMKLEGKEVIEFEDIIGKFNELNAIIIPVLWGGKDNHGNGLTIHLPDSNTIWVFVNLDSNVVDFKFWMTHELGHPLAPNLAGEPGDEFAERFAEAILFPESQAADLRAKLESLPTVSVRIAQIREMAKKHVISPLTVRCALEAYEEANGLSKIPLGEKGAFMGAVTNFSKSFPTVTETLFKQPPTPKEYAAVGRKSFGSPFFEALSAFCKQEEGAEHFIRMVLGMSMADAKALAEELRG